MRIYYNKLIYITLFLISNQACAFSEKDLLQINLSGCPAYSSLMPAIQYRVNTIYSDFKTVNSSLLKQLIIKEKLLQIELNKPNPNQKTAIQMVQEVSFLREQMLTNSTQMQLDMQKSRFHIMDCWHNNKSIPQPQPTKEKFKHKISTLPSSPSQGLQSSGIQGLEINASQNLNNNNAKD
jgi:hypothetical protein